MISGTASGIALGKDSTVTNNGNITGSTFGVYFGGGELTNAGTISGSSFAVDGDSAFTLNIDPGAVFKGDVQDIAGDGTLNLDGTINAELRGLGTSFAGFNDINIATGAAWTLEGNTAGLANGQTITGFTLGDTLVLDGFAATSEAVVYNNLVLSNGSSTETLGIQGDKFAQNFSLSTSGGDTTVEFASITSLDLISTISSTFHTGIILSNGYYAPIVTITQAGNVSGIYAGGVNPVTQSLINDGLITGNFDGVFFLGGRGIDNAGTIVAENGIHVNTGGTVTNSGTIFSNGGVGIGISQDGTLLNSGLIAFGASTGAYGNFAVFISNSGSIFGNKYGVELQDGSSLTNTGEISSQTYGVRGDYTGAIINRGTISGNVDGIKGKTGIITNAGTISGGTDAILNSGIPNFGSPFELIVDSGAVFNGAVVDTAGNATLVLTDETGGDLDMGASFTGFSTITFDHASTWTLEGTTLDLTSGQTITGFAPTDTIILDGFAATSETYVSGVGLELFEGSSSVTLGITGGFHTGDFVVTDPPGSTTISVTANAPCFVAGTRILTPRGEVAVEDLRVGEVVITHAGEDREIVWIGRRKLDLSRHPHPKEVQPVCIVADALGEGVPRRDLLVSPDHALFVDAHLIPAKALLNEANVYQLSRESVVYYHVELAEHAVIFAEGAAAESYLETGNRGAFENAFENGGGALILHPDFAQAMREAESCAPFVETGSVVDAVRMRIVRRFQGGMVRRRDYGSKEEVRK
jgi:hypothetical protein